MKKFLMLLTFIPFVANCQVPDSLKKYSYLCFSLDKANKQIHSGTCFFYKKDSITLLLTNFHVISGISTANDSVEFKPMDTLHFICDSIGKKAVQTMVIRGFKIRHALYFEHTDFIGVSVNFSHGNSVNYINNLIDTNIIAKKPDSVCVIGYPTIRIKTDGVKIYSYEEVVKTGTYNSDFKFDFIPVFIPPNYKTDMSEKDVIEKLRKTEFLISSRCESGQSGSPIFGQYKLYGKMVYRLVGILWGTGDKNLPYSMAYDWLPIYRQINHR